MNNDTGAAELLGNINDNTRRQPPADLPELQAELIRYQKIGLTPLFKKLNINDTKLTNELYESIAKAQMLAVAKQRQADLTAVLGLLPDEKVGTPAIPLIQSEIGYNVAVQDIRAAVTRYYGGEKK